MWVDGRNSPRPARLLRFPRNDERGEGHDGGGGCAGTTEEGEGNDGGPQPRRPWVPASAGTTEREAGTTEREAGTTEREAGTTYYGDGHDGRGRGMRGSSRHRKEGKSCNEVLLTVA